MSPGQTARGHTAGAISNPFSPFEDSTDIKYSLHGSAANAIHSLHTQLNSEEMSIYIVQWKHSQTDLAYKKTLTRDKVNPEKLRETNEEMGGLCPPGMLWHQALYFVAWIKKIYNCPEVFSQQQQ